MQAWVEHLSPEMLETRTLWSEGDFGFWNMYRSFTSLSIPYPEIQNLKFGVFLISAPQVKVFFYSFLKCDVKIRMMASWWLVCAFNPGT